MLRFGIFDWLDDSRRGLAVTWEQRLRMLEYGLTDEQVLRSLHLFTTEVKPRLVERP